ncbi:MAG: ThuA domain-containing protein [Kiritimatiellaeota bacterium]|nr:ThuA domain-containing protein [Kiritimatiellota bacterium]
MNRINTLVLSGGTIHDFRGCGQSIRAALREDDRFAVTYVEEDLSVFDPPGLEPFDLVVLYYTRGEVTDTRKNGLLNWLAAGKGFVGIHAAVGAFRNSPEYRAMIGGCFMMHPPVREYQVSVVDPEHPITKGIVEFMVKDEQFIIDHDRRANVLCTALHRGEARPVAWTKSWGEGRVFYLALGHTPEACRHEMFKALLQRGADWAGTPPNEL